MCPRNRQVCFALSISRLRTLGSRTISYLRRPSFQQPIIPTQVWTGWNNFAWIWEECIGNDVALTPTLIAFRIFMSSLWDQKIPSLSHHLVPSNKWKQVYQSTKTCRKYCILKDINAITSYGDWPICKWWWCKHVLFTHAIFRYIFRDSDVA